MEYVIEHALVDIKLKEERKLKEKMKKSNCNKQHYKHSCEELHNKLDEGKNSAIFVSQIADRKRERREAISEKNKLEGILVTQTVKRMMQETNMVRYKIL